MPTTMKFTLPQSSHRAYAPPSPSYRGYREGHVDYGLNDNSGADRSYLLKELEQLREDNERLRRRVDDQQEELDRLQGQMAKADAARERTTEMDRFLGKSRASKATKKLSVVSKDDEDHTNKSAESSSTNAAAPPTVDIRKLHDEFKKPLDDTRAILNDFGIKRHAPTFLEVAQAEAMREHVMRVTAEVGSYQTKIDALNARHPVPSKLSRPQRSKFESTLSELMREKKRIEEQCGALRDKFIAKRDDVLAKTSSELVRAHDAYDKAYEDLVKPKGEAAALERIGELCLPLTLEKIEENEGCKPVQPADLGPSTNIRTLCGLIERADLAIKPEGPLERLANATVQQGGVGCTIEMGPLKGFRRSIHKAEHDYGGDYLQLNDVARCSIVAPKLSTLAECLRWLMLDAKAWAKTDDELPSFEPLLCKDRLSPMFDAEGAAMYR